MEPEHPPRPTHVNINVTVTVNLRLSWLMSGIAIGTLQAPDLVPQLTGLVLAAAGHL